MKSLAGYPWPGNVSQLKATVERLAGAPAEERNEQTVRDWLLGESKPLPPDATPAKHEFDQLSPDDAERQAVYLALQAMNFNLSRAASVLGISRPTLYSKMKRFKICTP